ncbi:mediator of RNA polymerase II transcription subunit 15a-like [Arachis stenosperma]|uniref:mediator of RNA polymerase II transcription subunit 15a-like n=1 Tax=Arachis stenosperma TaxID=217475 RepID=UPI0025ABAB68|nr:mediator of RNA polymerase II transcription subunit 15a-like [Arachis stenosperma]XP_057733214.1 mediator of RNA polymerase II transcription subunit 15a-like [Arachis stenosperma]XP_057733215.1 mediator of RNA polymerase II transcription subunit 15a-like [Arachis stenosperma]XP_057733216.1 mediator of RNA polymerase II transcription subunit 15a-like [Arachis stenosperma]
MDANNWRPNQGNEPTMDAIDWRSQLTLESRQRIVNKIMETLKKHLPVPGGPLVEVQNIAQRFEEKIYTAATSQTDYLRKISTKMLTIETKTQNTIAANNMPSNQAGPSNSPSDQGLVMQQHSINLPNQPQQRQQILSQNIQSSNASSQPNLPPVSSLAQTSSQNIGQNSNIQNMTGQNTVGSTIGQNSNVLDMFSGSQRQMTGRQQVVPQQQQQQPQNAQQYLYQQQFMKPKFQLQSQMHPQQQQNLLQTNQIQPSLMQSSPLSSLPQNQQSHNVQQSSQSMIQQTSQVMRHQQQQNSIIHQQQTPLTQPLMMPLQQQQQLHQLMGSQSNVTNMQHPQMLGPQNNVGDIQQQQRLLSQQNNLTNLQQLQQQQPLLNQQSNLANMNQQQLGNTVPGLRQQRLIGPESGNPGMQTRQHSAHMLQQTKVPLQQHSQQNGLLPSQAQQPRPQAAQQQLMPQINSQPSQSHLQLGSQQQPDPLQRDMQQGLQPSGSLIEQQNVLDHQKQIYQSQRAFPETSSSLDSPVQTVQPSGGDWQEEVYQKIKTMKESYLPELREIYQRVVVKYQQHESLHQQARPEQADKFGQFKVSLNRMMDFLQIPKNKIQPALKEKVGAYEKMIIGFIHNYRPRKGMSSTQLGQLPPPHTHPMSQPQSQVTQVQSHENQINSQLHQSNLPGSVATMPQNNITSLQHNSNSGLSAGQQNMMNSMQPGSNMDPGQGNSTNSLQQVPVSSLQQNPVSTPQQTNLNSMSLQGGMNVVQQNLNILQVGSNMLQHQQLKHQQDQKMLQNQQFKQYQHRQMMQRQQSLQQQQQQHQLHQPGKQQLSAMQTHQMAQLPQMNDINDIKFRQGMGAKPGVLQQHLTPGQHSTYSHQQLKQGAPFSAWSPQFFQVASPQIPQNSSPQVEQQNHAAASLTKVGTPLQSSNSPFVGPTPSPPLAPSPMPADSEKQVSGVSSVSNAASVGQQQAGAVGALTQSLAIGTPGISASPLLAEFSGLDGAQGNAAAPSGKSTVTEQPIERLTRLVKSMSSKALSAAVSDIASIVSMNDRIAGSAPGNGSRSSVGEDLVSMTNFHLQGRNLLTQDGPNGTKKMKRDTSAKPLNIVSSDGGLNDSTKHLSDSEASDMDSTATSSAKRPKIEVNHALMEEIREINNQLVDTVVNLTNEDINSTVAAEAAEGTLVKCSYTAMALSASLKSQYASAQSPVQPLRLFVPANYPSVPPIFLDKFPGECSKDDDDLSAKTKSRFSLCLRLTQPMSLREIARTWGDCARAVISEQAQKAGVGGTFSSNYGGWEDCLTFD